MGIMGSGILSSRPRTDAYFPPVLNETDMPVLDEDGQVVLNDNITLVNVTLRWRNPAEVYLPSPPAVSRNLTSLRIEWVSAEDEGMMELVPQLDESVEDYFDPAPGAENSYRLAELR